MLSETVAVNLPPQDTKEMNRVSDEELTKIAWTRELTDERVRIAAAYWLDCSPHERTEADGIILARYARMAMDKLELAIKALEEIHEKYMEYLENEVECDSAASTMEDITLNALKQIRREQGHEVSNTRQTRSGGQNDPTEQV